MLQQYLQDIPAPNTFHKVSQTQMEHVFLALHIGTIWNITPKCGCLQHEALSITWIHSSIFGIVSFIRTGQDRKHKQWKTKDYLIAC